ncbi:MAG: hypothetical protein A2X18_07710 [Bacteroidetes bacterium GWF2_40_14]|nr:MAG: hypothetical protein A2X18_07710 [Bacteroidetes bacterium GWF2_40_14]
MAIVRVTPLSDINGYLEDQLKKQKKKFVLLLTKVGEECVNVARNLNPSEGSYTDQTGNLRSSIGYVVIDDGVIIRKGGFQQVHTGSEGVMKGRLTADELAISYSDGLVLIVIAGMKYAAYVEAMNYDVLTSSELYARKRVPELIEKLKL